MVRAAWLLAACLLCVAQTTGRRHAPDLREDDPARRSSRPAECQFGKQAKELGSTWFADLGPPFGVMYCIKCECIPVQKKRRVVARVQCKNIKEECPAPTCDSPILLPGRCCKVCPGEVNAPDMLSDSNMVVTANEEDELSLRHFGALLTGRSAVWIKRDDMTRVSIAKGSAAGRFVFRRRHLYWSVMLSETMPRKPRALIFLDKDGAVLIEHSIQKAPGFHSDYETATGKVCGVWRRVPREYKRELREGSLYAALVWGDEGKLDSALVGRVDRYAGLGSEMFSALLEPDDGYDRGSWGGTAALTANTGAAPSLHVSILFNGVFAPIDIKDSAVRIIVMSLDKNTTIINEVRTLEKPGHDINIVEVSTPVSISELRWLSRGRVAVIVRGTGGTARGVVRQRATCDVFQAPLSGEPHGSGLAMVYVDQEGSLVYNLQVEEQIATLPKITLVDDYGKRHTQIEILDNLVGTRQRPSPRMFGPLYQDQLSVHLASENGMISLRGRLLSRPIPDAAGGFPVLLKRSSNAPATANMVAIAWITVDNLCTLNYEVTAAGSSIDSQDMVYDVHLASHESSTGKLLGSIDGTVAEGSILEPESSDLIRLSTGTSVMQIRESSGAGAVILYGEISQFRNISAVDIIKAFQSRKPKKTEDLWGLSVMDVESIVSSVAPYLAMLFNKCVEQGCFPSLLKLAKVVPLFLSGNHKDPTYYRPISILLVFIKVSLPKACAPARWESDNEVNLSQESSSTCKYNNHVYDDGAQWINSETCMMCGCVHGRVRCDPVRCPPIHCSVPTVKVPGECCPVCTQNSTITNISESARGCVLAGQFHTAGSSWHPYLAPDGYDTCAVCTCEYNTLNVRCPRLQCPPLKCTEREAYRPDRKSCCKVCPPKKEAKEDGTPRDQGRPKTAAEIIADGGCVFPDGPLPNGKEVHPNIHSLGEDKCVTCRCKDGVVTCTRVRCPRGSCSRKRRMDRCCECRRQRRHPKTRTSTTPLPHG